MSNPRKTTERTSGVSLESLLCTEELDRRPSRPPDHEAENRALVALAQALADSPHTILQTLADTILEVFGCGSAGVSVLTEDATRFHWPAIAGAWKPHIGDGTPRDFSPCGDVLDRNMPLMMRHVERRYTYLQPVTPAIEECLLVPFSVAGQAVGTIWAVIHSPEARKFDSEDLRLLVSLARFASSAYQAAESLGKLSHQGATLRDVNEALLVSSVRQHELAEQAQQAEAALRRSEQEIRAAKTFAESIFETLHEPLLVLNADLTVRIANPAFYRHFQVAPDETVGRRIYELGNGQWDIPALRELLENVLPADNVFTDYEVGHEFETLGGRVMLVNGRRLDHVPLILLGIRDITGRKQDEEALRQARDELEQRVEERTGELRASEARLRALAMELTRAEQRERRRLAIILHDHLQQLIVAAHMHVGLAAREAERPGQRDSLNKGQEIISEALQICRTLAVELSPPLLHDQGLAPALAWLAGRMRESHRLTVEFSSDEGAGPQSQELRELLFQAARELLLNVVKHAGSGIATMRLARDVDGRIRLDVEDEGQGFDPEAREVEERSRQSFGLFHLRERLHAAGGVLEIASAPGRGTRVRLIVPEDLASRPDGSNVAATGAALVPRPHSRAEHGAGRSAGAIRVLVVDDHAIVREGLIAVLHRQPDFEVVGEAVDGNQAVDLACELQPDVVLMDVTLPGISGVAATGEIAAALPGLPVIGLSAHAESDMRSAMLEAGAVDYLTKGGPSSKLVEAIRAATHGKQSAAVT